MATALELLSGVSTNSADKTLVVSNDFRTIYIPPTVPCLGVEYDDDVLVLDFKMPRYVSTTDLSTFAIRINYMNTKGEKDCYTVRDAVIGSEYITFNWRVGPTATRYKGNTAFNVCAKTLTSEGHVDREFNTTPATLPVLEGLEVDPETAIVVYTDLLEQWRQELFGVGDTEEANMRAVSQKEQENIVQKGAEVLASLPEDYTETYKLAQESARTKADAIVSTVQDKIITVSDSSDDLLRGLKLFGKTTQVTTAGKQLARCTAGIQTSNGITFMPNADGSITISGTSSTGDAYYVFDNNNAIPDSIKNIELIVSIAGSDNVSVVVGCYTGDDTFINDIVTINSAAAKTFTYPTEAIGTRTFLAISKNTTINATVYPLIRLATIADDTYEPYSGGLVSPSPGWSQSLNSVGNDGGVTTYIHNNNLANLANATFANCLLIDPDEGSVRLNMTDTHYGVITFTDLNEYLLANQGKTFTFKVNNNPSDAQLNVVIFGERTADNRGTASYQESNGGAGELTVSITPIGFTEITSLVLRLGRKSATYTDQSTTFTGISFTRSLYTEFEPSAGIQSVTADYALPGIKVPSGGNYTDSDGQQWICDEIDYEHGKYIKRIAEITLDGTHNYKINNYQLGATGKYLFEVYPGNISQAQIDIPAMSDKLIWDKWGNFTATETRAKMYATSGRIIIFMPDQTIQTVDDFAAYLTENPIRVMYERITPFETSLTQEEIAAYKALRSNKPNTTVLNDSGVKMELKYNADTEIWLENRLAEHPGTGGSGGEVTAIDFTNFDTGTFTETVDGEVITHSVTFDDSGRPSTIDGVTITW